MPDSEPAGGGGGLGSRIALVTSLAVIVAGFARAFALRWYCDDTFITLRYVENYLAGEGFVYNAGEYVEGYTHFLWLVLLTFAGLLGVDPLDASLALGLASLAGVLAVFSVISYKLNARRLALFVPFTALALAANHDFVVWATGGLETMFLTFLFAAAFYIYFFSGRARRLRLFGTGALLILAALTRPDAALVLLLANFLLIVSMMVKRAPFVSALADLVVFNLPFVILAVPYLVWKQSYYGGLLPNTYYAKSAGSSYYERGFYYLWLYFKCYFTSFLALLAFPALAIGIVRAGGPGSGLFRRFKASLERPELSALMFAVFAVAAYLVLFVARVGGDFMYARFVVPAVPFIMFAIETGVARLSGGSRVSPLIAFAIIALSIGFVEHSARDELLQKTEHGRPRYVSHKGIIDEHYLRTEVDDMDEDVEFGRFLRPYFEGLDATVLLKGRACIGYYAGFKTCIENFGLTDEYIAHLPVEERSRPGHEKEAPHQYLVERGVDFVFNGQTQFLARARIQEFTWFELPGGREERVQLITYDADLISTLSRRMGDAFRYTNFPSFLDNYIVTELPRKSRLQFLAEYMIFRDFYFLYNDDPERERPFLRRLRGNGGR